MSISIKIPKGVPSRAGVPSPAGAGVPSRASVPSPAGAGVPSRLECFSPAPARHSPRTILLTDVVDIDPKDWASEICARYGSNMSPHCRYCESIFSTTVTHYGEKIPVRQIPYNRNLNIQNREELNRELARADAMRHLVVKSVIRDITSALDVRDRRSLPRPKATRVAAAMNRAATKRKKQLREARS